MQKNLRTELTRFILLGLSLLALGWATDRLLLALLLGNAAYILWLLFHLVQLFRWLRTNHPPPKVTGVWFEIYRQIYRKQRRSERATESHRLTLKQVRSITASLDEGLLLLKPDRTLDWWNTVANELFELKKTDRNQPITELVKASAFDRFIDQDSFPEALEITLPDNPQRPLMFSAATLDNGNIVLVARDITQLRKLESMRRDFVANISHELRTPLTVIAGYVETLQDNVEELPQGWHKALQQMQQQSKRINKLTNDLVVLSQLESMDDTPARERVELEPMLTQIVTDAAALSEGKHTLQLTCEADLYIIGDSSELYSAFSNLVFNAIKHSPEGADIDISAYRDDQSIVVSIADDGPGIDPKHIPRLTERFYRPDRSRASNTGGTGLGLAIVKHVLLRHHGTLSITSKIGEGSTFTCRFAITKSAT